MTMYARLVLLVSMLLPISALAYLEYDREQNIVTLNSESRDTGWIHIYNKRHILVGGMGFDVKMQKITSLCSKQPSLGLLMLDGNLQNKLPPNVTGVILYKQDNPNGYYVHSYILKGEDAQDLLDMLYEYRKVGFVISSQCPDSESYKSGIININFDTRGLERALNRIK